MLLLVALSFTNLLEGLSIGFQRTTKGVWNLVVAILIMDSIVSFCMGLQMVTVTGYEKDHMLQKVKHSEEKDTKTEASELTEEETKSYGTSEENLTDSASSKKKTTEVVVSAFVYSAMTSLGIIIGTVVIETVPESQALNLANGILQAIAAGTFLYTTFFEVLFGEVDANSPVSKLSMLVLGFTLIALLTIQEEEMMSESVAQLHINTSTTLAPPENITTTLAPTDQA